MSKAALLTLPTELQVYIYELVLITPEPILLGLKESEAPSTSLLATCHNIRNVAAPIYYGQNSFSFVMHDEITQLELRAYLASMQPTTLRLCKSIKIVVDNSNYLSDVHRPGCYPMWNGRPGYIRVDFSAKKVEADLKTACCGAEQLHFMPLVAHLEEMAGSVPWCGTLLK